PVISIGNTRLRFSLDSEVKENATATVSVPSQTAQPPTPVLPELSQTVLQADELTPLCQFMAAAVEETDPRALVRRALQTIHRQTAASITGFLSLDEDDPLPKLVMPESARVDVHLSRQLTQLVQRQGRAVWLGSQVDEIPESESLLSFKDALCLPLQAGETALGAVHVYKTGKLFTERNLRFCQI